MKKYLVSFVLLFCLGYLGKAGGATDPIPESNHGNDVFFSDYGGYQISTGAFTVGIVTATSYGVTMGSETCRGVFEGINFSTGNTFNNDFVEVYDSTDSNSASSGTRLGRWYNSSYNTSVSTIAAGWVGPKAPIQFRKGLRWFCSSSQYNYISVMYRQLSGDRGQ